MKRTIAEAFGVVVVVFILVAFFCAVVGAQSHVDPIDGGAIEPEPVDPAQCADQLFNTPSGNYVRIIGGKIPEDAAVLPSPIGDAVNVPTVPADALCNVILDAVPVDATVGPCSGRRVPAVLELAHAFGDASCPVEMSGTEDGGKILWNVMLRGAACVTAADAKEYVASSMGEVLPLGGNPPKWKCRLARAQIQVEEEVQGQRMMVNKTVSVCDPRVDREKAQISIPHAWSGRYGDLNYRKVEDNMLQPRVKKVVKEIK